MMIQSCISGYGGKPATVYSLFDGATGILVVAKETELRKDRFDKCVIVSNILLPAREAAFSEDNFKDAVDALYDMRGAGKLVVESAATRADPTARIESDAMDVNGRKFRIHPDITNGQIAVLAAVWYARGAPVRSRVVAMAGTLAALNAGGIVSI